MDNIKKKNNVFVIAVCCLFTAGITLLVVFLFNGGIPGGNKNDNNANLQDSVNDKNIVYDGGNNSILDVPDGKTDKNINENNISPDIPTDESDTLTPFFGDDWKPDIPPGEERERADVPYNPVTGGRVSGRMDGSGNQQWSTDGGKTWSNTPPDGMPEPGNHSGN